MKDEIYPPPPPRPRRAEPGEYEPPKAGRNRRLYSVFSIAIILFAIMLNFTNNTNLISFKAKPDLLAEGAVEVAVRLQNYSAMELYVSRYYSLEALEGGQWVKVAENTGDFDPAYFYVGRFGGQSLTFGRYGVFEPLAPGSYRIAIDFYAPRTFVGTEHNRTLYAEFEVAHTQ